MPIYNYPPTVTASQPPIITASSYTLSDTSDFIHLLFDTTSNAITCNLPTAVGNAQRIKLTLVKNDADADVVTIDGNSTETINLAGPGAQQTQVLYLVGDSITIVSDGTNWVVVEDTLQPHVCDIHRDAAGTIASGSTTLIECDDSDYDNAGIGNASGDASANIVIKRTGYYSVFASWKANNLDDEERALVYFYVNGTGYGCYDVWVADSSGPSPNLDPNVRGVWLMKLNSGDDLDLRVLHYEDDTQALIVTEPDNPRLRVHEMR